MHTTKLSKKSADRLCWPFPAPSSTLLHLKAGAAVELAVEGERLIVQPQNKTPDTRWVIYWPDTTLMPRPTTKDRAWIGLAPAGPGAVKRGDIYLVSLDPDTGT